jgi:hypothetical protein
MRFEVAILTAAKKAGTEGEGGVVALPGVKRLLAQLSEGAEENRGGAEQWAICTSCTSLYFRLYSFTGAARWRPCRRQAFAPAPACSETNQSDARSD